MDKIHYLIVIFTTSCYMDYNFFYKSFITKAYFADHKSTMIKGFVKHKRNTL